MSGSDNAHQDDPYFKSSSAVTSKETNKTSQTFAFSKRFHRGVKIVPRLTIIAEELNSHELNLLHCAAEGDLKNIRKIFLEHSYYDFDLNVNCLDSLDRSALSLAIINRHLNVVQFLLSDAVRKYGVRKTISTVLPTIQIGMHRLQFKTEEKIVNKN